jgi:hypothetical protein
VIIAHINPARVEKVFIKADNEVMEALSLAVYPVVKAALDQLDERLQIIGRGALKKYEEAEMEKNDLPTSNLIDQINAKLEARPSDDTAFLAAIREKLKPDFQLAEERLAKINLAAPEFREFVRKGRELLLRNRQEKFISPIQADRLLEYLGQLDRMLFSSSQALSRATQLTGKLSAKDERRGATLIPDILGTLRSLGGLLSGMGRTKDQAEEILKRIADEL